MELILHIGDGKTGTTSIQNTLFKNKELLLKSGILYHVNSGIHHFDIIYALGGKTRVPQNRHAELKARALKLIDEIRELSLKHKTKYILISAESLFSLSSEQQQYFISSFNLTFTSVKIVAYIRNHADTYLSMTQQRIKADHTFENPFLYKRNIHTSLQKWHHLAGDGNMIVRAYDKKLLVGGSVVTDFIEVVENLTETAHPNLALPKNESNTSLSAEQMILLQRFRRDFLSAQQGVFHPKSTRLLDFYIDLKSINILPMTKVKLKPELHSMINQNNEKFIKGVDKLFDTNLLDVFSNKNESIELGTSKSSYVDISDILGSFDEDTLNFMSQLIPDYNPTLKTPNFEFVFHDILEDPLFNLCYSKYLLSEGLDNFSNKLLTHSFRRATELRIENPQLYNDLSIQFLKVGDSDSSKKAKERAA